MQNRYNKGRFRFSEYGKHLRPYLKQKGNKRWRKTVDDQVEEAEMELLPNPAKHRNRKGDKRFKARITYYYWRARIATRTNNYRSKRDALNAIQRPNVLCGQIYEQGNWRLYYENKDLVSPR